MGHEMRIFIESDADPKILEGRTIAVAGYGNQGRPQALNLRDSGFTVIVGAREGRDGWRRAREDGFEAMRIGEAAGKADVIMMLLPDEIQGDVYRDASHTVSPLRLGR
jgi:ketol-acid reductoisomerase